MISKQEIIQQSLLNKVRPEIIEKDYVLGWILAGINNHKSLSKHWVFKGGTCLKKCYFKDYRFLEDLDFTLTKDASTHEGAIKSSLEEVCNWVYEKSGVEIKSLRIKPFLDIQKRRIPSFEGSIGYSGPQEPKGSPPSIKLDLTQSEEILDPPHLCQIFHQYSDYEEQIFRANTYSFEEIFAEKTRA